MLLLSGMEWWTVMGYWKAEQREVKHCLPCLPHGSPALGHQHHCLQLVWTVLLEALCFWQQKWKWVAGLPVRPMGSDRAGEKFLIWETWTTASGSLSPCTSFSYLQTFFLQNPLVSCSPESWLSHLCSPFHLQITLLIQSNSSHSSWGCVSSNLS